MGVGRLMPFFSRVAMTGAGNFMSRKFLMGGATLSPSTMMCHFLRSSSHSARLSARMAAGGRQPVSMDFV